MISELYDRGVRNFVVTEEDFKRMENGEWKMENAMQAAIIIHYPLFIIHYFSLSLRPK